jgi:hypothetical protein
MSGKERGARSEEQMRRRAVSLRLRRFASAFAFVYALVAAVAASAEPFTFDDIQFWVGEGTNRAALAVDWSHTSTGPPALVWGYRWDGTANGIDMLTAIVEADPRFYAKLGLDEQYGDSLFGLGYDNNDDGQFALEDYTEFDYAGIARTSPIYVPTTSTDPADLYAEGWFSSFAWHYGVSIGNPYAGGSWSSSGVGMSNRWLSNSDWDSWTYAPLFSTTDFAENPQAAVPPWGLPGDFDGSGVVDEGDYTLWKNTFGLTGDQAADGNGNGVVDAADYTVWRDHCGTAGGGALTTTATVPEPATALMALAASIAFAMQRRRLERERQYCSPHLHCEKRPCEHIR